MNAILAVPNAGRHAVGPDVGDKPVDLERYRADLVGYCRGKLGSVVDAEDAAQETLIRAWRSLDRFEGRAMLRSWLYCIATNVCIDMLRARQRQAVPTGLDGAASSLLNRTAAGGPGCVLGRTATVASGSVAAPHSGGHDPADEIAQREELSHAFVRMLRLLPPRQRAVLFLREVLRWRAHEVAELLGTTTAAVNSGLQRARATLAAEPAAAPPQRASTSDGQGPGATQYVEAFASYDVDTLVSLLYETATTTPSGRSSTVSPATNAPAR